MTSHGMPVASVFVSLFNHLINHIVRLIRVAVSKRLKTKSMTLFSSMRKLVGLALAMLVIATSVQPVQAQFRHGEFHGHWLTSNSSAADSHGILEAALYISEENESQTGRKGPSQRLATGDPVATEVTIPSLGLFFIDRNVPSYRAVHADDGQYLSPLKTGPPSL